MPSHLQPHQLREPRRREGGFTTIEMVVAIAITAIVAAIIGGLVLNSTRASTVTQARHETQNALNTASVQLIRDVSDGSRIRTGEPGRLGVDVVRDGTCQTREWSVNSGKLIVVTTFYDGPTCTGGSKTRTQDMVSGLDVTATGFTYYSTMSGDNVMTLPVATVEVSRVGWVLAATPDHPDTTTALRLESGAAFTPKGSATDGTGTIQDAKSPVLSVITGKSTAPGTVEGVDKPVLTWVDATRELTSGWAVFRIANPEGMAANDPARTTWTQVVFIPTTTPAPEVMKWTDASLPAGYTAQYVVRAVVPSGNGPESNQASTGLRPDRPATVEVDGTGLTMKVAWKESIGATGYDIYRSTGAATAAADGTLELYRTWSQISGVIARSGTTLSWSESLPAGSSYYYTVVATNRWERLATDPARKSQTQEVAVRTVETAAFNAVQRLRPARDGDFTIAAAPTMTVALTSSTSATDYSTQVTWVPATWTGGGPAAADGKSRDVRWTATRNGASIWTDGVEATKQRTDSGTTADGLYTFTVATCNDSGCSATASARVQQRPAVPSCSAGVSGLTTRQATVTSATSSSATSWQIQKVTGPGSAAMGGVKAASGARQVVYGELGHNAGHTWQARSTNVAAAGVAGGGTSAWGAACAATTTELRVWLSDGTASTRSVGARLNNTGGNNANLTVEGVQTQPSSGGGQMHTFDPLAHGTAYTLTARLSDGYNNVAYQDVIATARLATPALSFGTTTTRSVQVYVSCGNGSSCTAGMNGDGGSGSGATFDRLADGVTHTFYGRNSDGHNVVVSSAQRATPLLSVSTPTCNATRDSQYAPTTVRFSSNGSLNRTSAVASSAGTYSATATNTVTDGYNTNSRTNTCGVSVEPPPLPSSSISAKSTYSRYCSADDNSHRGFEVKATWSAEPGTTYAATVHYLLNGSPVTRALGTTSGASWQIVNPQAVFKYVSIRATNAYGSVDVEASTQGGGCIPV